MSKGEKQVAVVENSPPAFLQHQGSDRGSEQMGREDITIPRLEIVQSLSKARKKTDPAFIEGAEEGTLYNSVTRELYGFEVNVVPVFFLKEYLLWRDQKLGGGFGGGYPTELKANEARDLRDKPEEWEVVMTHQHFCLIQRPDGKLEEAAISMSKSKLKVSKKFNSLVRVNGGDRFSRVYRIRGIADQNNQGQDFYNLSVDTQPGFVTEPVYRAAERVYELIAQGGVVADRGQDDLDEPDPVEY